MDASALTAAARRRRRRRRRRFDLGLFDPKDAYAWPTADDVGTDASAAMSLTASQESIVLLRNDGQLLPLPKGKKIAVVGPHAGAKKVLVQVRGGKSAQERACLFA